MTAEEQQSSSARYFQAFDDLAKRCPDLARDLLGRLLDNIKELDKRIRRDLVGLVLLACAFELLNRNLLGEASAFGVKVAKLGFLRYLIPIGIAFLVFRIFGLVRDRNLLFDSIESICKKTYPELQRARILRLVAPPGVVLADAMPPDDLIAPRSRAYREAIYSFELLVAFGVIPVAFSGYAFVQLFRQSDPPFIGPIVVTVLTVVLLVAAVGIFVVSEKEFVSPPDG